MKSYLENMAVSSRVRLARNIDGLAFPPFAELTRPVMEFTEQATAVLRKTGRYRALVMSSLSQLEKQALIEKHLISPLMAANKTSGAALISPDERVSVMFNEEDHLRLQCITKGFDLISAFNELNQIDDKLISALPVSYDETLGFLTACPTNVGTGMRASVMMFLPALTQTQGMQRIKQDLEKVKIEVRGIFGEGTKASAYLYQISNKLSLGYSEFNIISAVMLAALSIAQAEAKAREQIIENDFAGVKDKSLRAYGLINFCHKLKMSELYDCYADIKLGEYYDFFAISNMHRFDETLSLCGKANLLLNGKGETGEEVLRAKQAKKIIGQVCKLL